MTNSNPDPPPTLEAAEAQFRTFLAVEGYPQTICWLQPGDVLVDTDRHFWVRARRAKAARHVAMRYAEGLGRNLGIELRAICATDTETFASVFVPVDDLDRQYHMMGRGLKLSCPAERYSTSTTTNPLKWLAVWLSSGRRPKILEP